MLKRILLALIFLTVSILIPLYFNDLLVFFITKLNAGWVFSTIYIRLLVIIFFAFSLHLLFSIGKKTRKINFIYTLLISLLPGFGISFIKPIYEGDYGYVQNQNLPALPIPSLSQETNDAFNVTEESQIVCFFTSNCPYCKALSFKLGLNIEAGQNLKVSAFFPSTKEAREEFLANNNGQAFNSYSISEDLFLACTGGVFPATFLINGEGEVENFWSGDKVNYTTLDRFFE